MTRTVPGECLHPGLDRLVSEADPRERRADLLGGACNKQIPPSVQSCSDRCITDNTGEYSDY